MKIKIVLKDGAFLPERKTEDAAAYDLRIPRETMVNPGRQIISCEFSIAIPHGYEAKVEPRSGFSAKGMEDANGERRDADVIPGKIDADYRGPIGVIVKSCEKEPFMLNAGDRIAQLTIYKVEDAEWEKTDVLDETQRGSGGFGSTGKK